MRRVIPTICLIALIACSTLAQAQRPGGGGRGGSGGGRGGGGGNNGGGGGDFRQRIMERMDANGNGILEPNEVSDRARGFLENMGLNPTRPINIQQAIQGGNGPRTSNNSASGGVPAAVDEYALVSGFGDETVAGFGVTPTMLAGKLIKLEEKYDQRVLDTVNRNMERYDKNGNGLLERDEWTGIPWQGDPRESDLDKDGLLTKAEMADRYAKRSRGEEENAGRDNRGGGRRGGFFPGGGPGAPGGRNPNGQNAPNDDNAGGRGGRGGGRGSGSGGGPGGGEDGGRGGRRGGRGGGGGFDPASMLERFDSDGDGIINVEDLPGFAGGMLARFGIDADKPINIAEVRQKIEEQQQNNGDAANQRRGRQPEKKKEIEPVASYKFDGAAKADRASFRARSERPTSGPRWWGERDKNKDGQVTLGEYLTNDSLREIKEFEEFDINHDGIVTAGEAAVGK